eukprot:1186810-Prorocentrum_minimum.AAC.2
MVRVGSVQGGELTKSSGGYARRRWRRRPDDPTACGRPGGGHLRDQRLLHGHARQVHGPAGEDPLLHGGVGQPFPQLGGLPRQGEPLYHPLCGPPLRSTTSQWSGTALLSAGRTSAAR